MTDDLKTSPALVDLCNTCVAGERSPWTIAKNALGRAFAMDSNRCFKRRTKRVTQAVIDQWSIILRLDPTVVRTALERDSSLIFAKEEE